MTTTFAANPRASTASNPTAPLYTFTSESVTEGHPDKVCDYIADSILDAYILQDRKSHVACEVLCKEDHAILAGEISSNGVVDTEQLSLIHI
mgnify:CR=1 FL=1